MRLINEKTDIRDQHRISVHVARPHGDWITPAGTDYLLGRGLRLETRTGLTLGTDDAFSAVSLTSPYRLTGGERLLRVECPGYVGLDQWTAVDPTLPGRLSYIDGCSNTNLVAPLRNGDPCLNYLYFPQGIRQTDHVHPSVRIGIVSAGTGRARYYEGAEAKELPLERGMIFLLPRFVRHSFHTAGSPLSVMVFHPDSDGGPLDEMNPMFSRTYRQPR